MALNRESFKTRTITAIVFVVIMLTGLLLNHWSFFILFSIIHFGCWMEYQKLIALINPEYREISPFHKYGIRIAGWCIMLYFTSDAFYIGSVTLHALGWWLGLIFLFILPLIELLFSGNIQLKNIAFSALGVLYISIPWGLMMDLRSGPGNFFGHHLDYGWIIPMVLIASIWINDTMAYIVGSFIGKTQLSKISPKKTWEGTIGGAIIAIALVSVIMKIILPQSNVWYWIAISSIAAVAGTCGDLFESKLKRLALVKDSGSLMPGHGGFLDRFDSLLFATPVIWVFIVLYAYDNF